jgi:hypothetical protein
MPSASVRPRWSITLSGHDPERGVVAGTDGRSSRLYGRDQPTSSFWSGVGNRGTTATA